MRVPLLSDQDTLHPIPTTSELEHRRLTVLHIGTLNKPIGTNLGYSPIETVIENVHQGLRACGHRSIVACSADSRLPGERHVTVPQSLGDYVRDDTVERGGPHPLDRFSSQLRWNPGS